MYAYMTMLECSACSQRRQRRRNSTLSTLPRKLGLKLQHIGASAYHGNDVLIGQIPDIFSQTCSLPSLIPAYFFCYAFGSFRGVQNFSDDCFNCIMNIPLVTADEVTMIGMMMRRFSQKSIFFGMKMLDSAHTTSSMPGRGLVGRVMYSVQSTPFCLQFWKDNDASSDGAHGFAVFHLNYWTMSLEANMISSTQFANTHASIQHNPLMLMSWIIHWHNKKPDPEEKKIMISKPHTPIPNP